MGIGAATTWLGCPREWRIWPHFFRLLLCLCVFGLPAAAQTESTGTTLSFPLKFQQSSPSISSPIELGRQEVKFRKEPDFGKDKVLRRPLKIGAGENDYIGLAVNVTRRTLYLDLNQNLDLTDDPGGVYQGEGQGGFLHFVGVQLKLRQNGAARSYWLDFYFYGRDSGHAEIRSSYLGEIELYGSRWQLEVQDNLDGQINQMDWFSVTPTGSGTEENRRPLGYGPIPAADKLFLGGHLYQLRFVFGPGAGSSPLTANLAEIHPELGELILEGKLIQRLILRGRALVVLDQPAQHTFLPVDSYRVQAVYLQSAPGQLRLSGNTSQIPPISIGAGTPHHLKLGWPLESSVKAAANGNMLRLDFYLRGAGGEQYALSNRNPSRAPRFAIYKGDRQLAAGNFEFG